MPLWGIYEGSLIYICKRWIIDFYGLDWVEGMFLYIDYLKRKEGFIKIYKKFIKIMKDSIEKMLKI